jgi:hypothetical protein
MKEDFTKFNPETMCDKLTCQNGFLCSNPEHHSVGEKVDFLENTLHVGLGSSNEITNEIVNQPSERSPTPTPIPTPSAPPANTLSFVPTLLNPQQTQPQQAQSQSQQPQPLPMPSAPPIIPLPSSNRSFSTSRESLISSCSSNPANMELDSNPPAYYEPRTIEKENPSNSMNIPNSQSDKQISIIINK